MKQTNGYPFSRFRGDGAVCLNVPRVITRITIEQGLVFFDPLPSLSLDRLEILFPGFNEEEVSFARENFDLNELFHRFGKVFSSRYNDPGDQNAKEHLPSIPLPPVTESVKHALAGEPVKLQGGQVHTVVQNALLAIILEPHQAGSGTEVSLRPQSFLARREPPRSRNLPLNHNG